MARWAALETRVATTPTDRLVFLRGRMSVTAWSCLGFAFGSVVCFLLIRGTFGFVLGVWTGLLAVLLPLMLVSQRKVIDRELASRADRPPHAA